MSPVKLERLVEDIRLSARENAGVTVRENHPGHSGFSDDHPSYHGYYAATVRGILDALSSDSDYGEARDARREYETSEPLTAQEAAYIRKRLGLEATPMRRSRSRRPSRDVQVIIRDGGSKPKSKAKPGRRSTRPRAWSKSRGPRRSWRGPGTMGRVTRKSGLFARDPGKLDLRSMSKADLEKAYHAQPKTPQGAKVRKAIHREYEDRYGERIPGGGKYTWERDPGKKYTVVRWNGRRDPQKLESLKHYSGKALLKLLKQADRANDEALAEAIGQELDKRAKRYGFARDPARHPGKRSSRERVWMVMVMSGPEKGHASYHSDKGEADRVARRRRAKGDDVKVQRTLAYKKWKKVGY